MNGPTKRNPLLKAFGIRLDEIDKLPEVNDGVNAFMEGEFVPAWQANAPVGVKKSGGVEEQSGEYRDSIKVTERSTNSGRGVVGATAEHAHLVEFGSVHNAEFAPAEKTAQQFGGTATSKRGKKKS